MTCLSATPAFGRDYKTKKQVQEAWNAGHDFILRGCIDDGRYINIHDLQAHETLNIRYKNLTEVCVIRGKS